MVFKALLRPLARSVTYTRGLHLALPMTAVALWMFIDRHSPWVPLLLAVPIGLIPGMRLAEAIQAQLFLTPHERGATDASIAVAPATDWADRWRIVLWLEIRLLLSMALFGVGIPAILMCSDLVRAALGAEPTGDTLLQLAGPKWWYALVAPLPILVLLAVLVGLGELVTACARWLLGPSASTRLHALEERTERLLENNRIARELHDSIGHSLTAMVLQAGAARAAGEPEFTGTALAAIEDTGRTALEDLERVLAVLREPSTPVDQRPMLTAASRLFDSARSAGATIDADITGPIERVSGPISREGYRILQEALTNALRHAGRVAVQVRVYVDAQWLELDVSNPVPAAESADDRAVPADHGSGLRGIRERAELLGGEARMGPEDGRWRTWVRLPTHGLG
ncbi:sensor histidine kinase [Nocardia vermiculata]|uniref:histidine kinase n=1 Tax=Nocardia vermiculata TaxID=257274 RepID=A0A846Y535_9NOCA|nr:histidine kinase [Nocardia vermiculata]NKY52388.1 sensor histidine kinase [Nocardia vermiculata]